MSYSQVVNSPTAARVVRKVFTVAPSSAYQSDIPQTSISSPVAPISGFTTLAKAFQAACGQVCSPFALAAIMNVCRNIP